MPEKEKKISSETIASIITELVNQYSNQFTCEKQKNNDIQEYE